MSKYILFISMLSISIFTNAQQIPVNNQYLINPFSLSPAYAGINGSVESFMSYRQQWFGIPGATRVEMININSGIGDNYGIGAELTSEQTGIFKTFSLLTTFAYHLKFTENQSLSFGIHSGIIRNHIDFSDGNIKDQSDPFFENNQDLSKTTFDAGFGALYRFKKLNIGYAVPRLLENQIINNNSDVLYTLKIHSTFHASYGINVNRNIEVTPFVVMKATQGSSTFDAAALCNYRGKLWAGGAYRKDGTISTSIGGIIYEKLVMNYSYEFSSGGMLGKSSGTHEISLGLLLGKNKSDANSPSIFKTTSSQPYYDWIEE